MRAVVDIGSNSVKFVVARDQRDVPEIVERGSAVTRLGRGLEKSGLLAVESLEKTRAALLGFAKIFKRYHSTESLECRVFATSAVRDCHNPESISALVQHCLGVPLVVLSGKEEARISLEGAVAASRRLFSHSDSLFIEIGGASTQLSVKTPTPFGESFQAGAVRCHERLSLGQGPLSDTEWQALSKNLLSFFDVQKLSEFSKHFDAATRPSAVGIGGTLVLAAKLAGGRPVDDVGYLIERSELIAFNNRLRNLAASQRLAFEGMEPGREDIIVVGLALLTSLLEYYQIEKIAVSTWGLRHGALRLWDEMS